MSQDLEDAPLYYGGALVDEEAQDDLFGERQPSLKLRLGYTKVVGADGKQFVSSIPEVDQLAGAELDYWVASAMRAQFIKLEGSHCFADYRAAERAEKGAAWGGGDEQLAGLFDPSTDWRPGGYVIERYKIGIAKHEAEAEWYADMEMLTRKDGSKAEYAYGPTPLIAAMRCFVRSVYGEEVPPIYHSCDLKHRPDPNVKFWRDDPVKYQAWLENEYAIWGPEFKARDIEFAHACALLDNELMDETEGAAK